MKGRVAGRRDGVNGVGEEREGQEIIRVDRKNVCFVKTIFFVTSRIAHRATHNALNLL